MIILFLYLFCWYYYGLLNCSLVLLLNWFLFQVEENHQNGVTDVKTTKKSKATQSSEKLKKKKAKNVDDQNGLTECDNIDVSNGATEISENSSRKSKRKASLVNGLSDESDTVCSSAGKRKLDSDDDSKENDEVLDKAERKRRKKEAKLALNAVGIVDFTNDIVEEEPQDKLSIENGQLMAPANSGNLVEGAFEKYRISEKVCERLRGD